MAKNLSILIRAELDEILSEQSIDQQLKNLNVGPLKIGLSLDTKEVGSLSQNLKEMQGIKFSNFDGAVVSTRKISAANAEMLKVKKQAVLAVNEENLSHIKNSNTLKESILRSRAKSEADKAQITQIRLVAAATRQQTAEADKLNLAQLRANVQITKFNTFLKKNPKLSNAYGEDIGNVNALYDTGSYKEMNLAISQLKAKAGLDGNLGKSFLGGLNEEMQKFAKWTLASGGVMFAINGLRNMVGHVKDLDVQMTELRKVTNETDATYNNFLKRAADNAVKLGATITDLVSASASFARMGYSIGESEELGKIATIYANVGDDVGGIDNASQNIISTMKAFNLSANESIRIVDIFNEVSNRYAITSGDLGNALQSAGAALSTSNNSLEQSVALWTAMNEILQDGDVAATSLRFITQRMRNTAGQLEEMGEDADGAAESITKLQQQVRGLTGVDIMADANTFRDTYSVLKDISVVWNDITDKDRADVIRLMAGQRQAAAFSALMENFKTAESALQVALDSSGSAMEEHSRWLDSIEGKTNQLSAAFQALSTNTIDSGFVKFLVDFSRYGIEAVDAIGLMNIALLALAFAAGYKVVPKIGVMSSAINALVIKLGIAKGATTALSTGLAVMIPIAAIIGGIAIIKHFTTSLEDQQDKVAKLNGEYEALNSELDSLNALDRPLTEDENARLTYLEKYKDALLQSAQAASVLEAKMRLLGKGGFWGFLHKGEAENVSKDFRDFQSGTWADVSNLLFNKNKDNYSSSDMDQFREVYDSLNEMYLAALSTQEDLRSSIALTSDEATKQEFSDAFKKTSAEILVMESMLDKLKNTGAIPFLSSLASESNAVGNSAKASSKSIEWYKEKIDDLLKSSKDLDSSLGTMSDAFKEQDENGRLSAKTILDIVDAGYAAALSIDATTGAARINKDAFIDLAKAKIQSQKADLMIEKSGLVKTLEQQSRAAAHTARIMAGFSGVKYFAENNAASPLVNSIDAQIKALDDMVASFDKVVGGNYKSSSSNSSTDKRKESFEKEYAYLGHLRVMDRISAQEYYDRLSSLDKKYYLGKDKYIEDHRKNLKELYDLQHGIDQDRIKDLEHEAFLLSKKEGAELEQVSLYRKIQNELHSLANKYREDLDENHEYIQELQKQWWSIEDTIESIVNKTSGSVVSHYEQQRKSLDTIIDLTIKLIKQESKDRVDGLNDQIDKYEAIVNLKKKSLDYAKKESEHQRTLSDKTKEIAKIQNSISKLSLDDSRSSVAERTKLEEELSKLQGDLSDYQSDYAYDKHVEGLDNELDAFKKTQQEKIKIEEANIDSTSKLYNLAISRIDNQWDSLYQDLMNWNSVYGDGISGEQSIASAWDDARDALSRYGSALGAINSLDTLVSDNSTTYSRAKTLAGEMKSNSSMWHTSSSADKKNLELANTRVAKEISQIIGKDVVRGSDGVWYLDKVGGTKLFDTYHSGGIVGSQSQLKHNEVISVLEKGEHVFSEADAKSLYKILDYGEILSKKMINFNLPDMTKFSALPTYETTNHSGLNFNPNIVVNVSGADASNPVKIGNMVANTALDHLKDAFSKKGLKSAQIPSLQT